MAKLTVFLTDLEDSPSVNQIMAEYFSESYPAWAVIGVSVLPRGAAFNSVFLSVLSLMLGFVAYQFCANALATRITTDTACANLFYLLLNTKITQVDIDTMFLHLAGCIDIPIYYEYYEGHPDRIKSCLLMDHIYSYIL